jgi:hypothetical protein
MQSAGGKSSLRTTTTLYYHRYRAPVNEGRGAHLTALARGCLTHHRCKQAVGCASLKAHVTGPLDRARARGQIPIIVLCAAHMSKQFTRAPTGPCKTGAHALLLARWHAHQQNLLAGNTHTHMPKSKPHSPFWQTEAREAREGLQHATSPHPALLYSSFVHRDAKRGAPVAPSSGMRPHCNPF